MQINVFYRTNLPKYYKVTGKYKKVMLKALGAAAKKNGELNLVVLGGAQILKINKKFIGHNYVTDVISFGYPCDGAGEPFGDVFICFDKAKKQAAQQGHGALFEMLVLSAHGTLHLAGYDDKTPQMRAHMNGIAEKIVKNII